MVNALANLQNQWDKDIVPTLYSQEIWRRLMPVNPTLSNKGIGVLNIKTLKYVARGNAVINMDIQQDIADTADISSANLNIPVQQDDCIIKNRDWQAYQLQNIPIGSDLAMDMAANIAVQRNALVAMGWKPDGTNYDIKGMYQVADNTVSGLDFDTFGNAYKTFAAAIKELKKDNIYSQGYNAIVSSLNYGELEGSVTSTGVDEMSLVLKLLNRDAPPGTMPGAVFECSDLADGTAMVAPVASQANLRYFDVIETQEPFNHMWFKDGNQDSGDIMVRQLGAMVPRFKHLNSQGKDPCICTITGLDSS